MNRRACIIAVFLLTIVGCSHTQTRGQAPEENEREDAILKSVPVLGDVLELANPTPQPVSGVALVYGLEGTGGGNPPGEYKKMLEEELRKQDVGNIGQMLASPDCAMVLANVLIPPGTRRGDLLDVEVMLPQQSRATSLSGGILNETWLKDYENSKTRQGNDRLLTGHILAKARGPLLVGLGEPNDEIRLRRGHVWQGAVALRDEPFYFYLKNDQRFASVANMVANRINGAFPDDAQKQAMVQRTKRLLVLDEVTAGINEKFNRTNSAGRSDIAKAIGKGDVVGVNVPFEYRLNPERYILVLRLIPLKESPETIGKYRNRLGEMLLDPKETIRAALRLEALGKESIGALKKGLESELSLVRFASAEALAYLGSTAGVEELGRLAQKHETVREGCLTALGSLNESASQAVLAKLLESPIAEVRVGAFRNLVVLSETADATARGPIKGALLNQRFWLHEVAPESTPLIHLASTRRAEVVVFGRGPALMPPFRLGIGSAFSIVADVGDTRCTITHYKVQAGKAPMAQCSLQVADVARTIAALGGQYPDAFDLLRQAEREQRLNCGLRIDALPMAAPIELLAACGADAAKFNNDPARQQEVLAAQEDLGMVFLPRVQIPKK